MTGNSAVRERTNSAERRAKVMGTDAHVIVVGDDAARLADLALARLERLEARWSRFLPESEISQLNERPGVPVVVAPETFQLIDHALARVADDRRKVRSDDPRRPPRRGLRPQLRASGSSGTPPARRSSAAQTRSARRGSPLARHPSRPRRRKRATRTEHHVRSRRDRQGIRGRPCRRGADVEPARAECS